MTTIDAALLDRQLLGAALGPSKTWETWLTVLRAAFGLELNRQERRAFRKVAGSRKPPQEKVREFWAIIGRRGGKSRAAAAVVTHVAFFVDHSDKLAPGEVGYVLCLSPTVQQAQLVFSYCLAFIESSPFLRQKLVSVTANEIRLQGNIVIAVHPNSFRTVRGRTLLAVVFDESAYWRDETSATPDIETYRAVLPSLATTNGMLIGISSPYRKAGLLFAKYRDHFGRSNRNILVVQGGTEIFNPTIDRSIVETSRSEDPEAARAEWDAEFRSDISALLDDATIDAAIEHGRPLEIPPDPSLRYVAFADASAGRHDAFCLCIGHQIENRFVGDVIRGRKPPFDPAEVAAEYASLAKDYRCSEIMGDNFAGEWVKGAFEKCGVRYRRSPLVKSQLYLESIPHWMRGCVSIPNHEKLLRELRLLERRTHRSGRDTVDHPQNGSDDYANVLVGAINLALADRPKENVATEMKIIHADDPIRRTSEPVFGISVCDEGSPPTIDVGFTRGF